jgi:hypothetical protein
MDGFKMTLLLLGFSSQKIRVLVHITNELQVMLKGANVMVASV